MCSIAGYSSFFIHSKDMNVKVAGESKKKSNWFTGVNQC